MASYNFNFDGGEHLRKMGASWFVSYSYFNYIDKSHMNWNKITTVKFRISKFNNTKNYHHYWLEQILSMNDNRLETNQIELDASTVKRMAMELLELFKKN